MDDFGFEGFGLTLGLGVWFLGGFLVLIACAWQSMVEGILCHKWFYPRAPLVVFATAAFIAGIVAEDLSDAMEDHRWWPECLFSSEDVTKVEAVFGRLQGGHPVCSFFARSLAAAGLFAEFGGLEGAALESAVLETPVDAPLRSIRTKTAWEQAIKKTYYSAKNTVYRYQTHFDELYRIEGRIDFARSLVFINALLFVAGLVLFLYLALRRSQQCKHYILALLSVFLVVGLAARSIVHHEEVEHAKRVFGYMLRLASEGEEGTSRRASYQLQPVSGIVLTDGGGLLAIHDFKAKDDCAIASLGFATSSGERIWEPIHLDDSKLPPEQRPLTPPPNDVESIVAIPRDALKGSNREKFLLIESGSRSDSEPLGTPLARRIFYVDFKHRENSYSLRIRKTIDIGAQTARIKNCEGAFLTWEKRTASLYLWLADRGENLGSSELMIVTGELDLKAGTFSREKSVSVPLPSFLPKGKGARACTDLFLAKGPSEPILYAAAAEDLGDWGPFRSLVYRLATLSPTNNLETSSQTFLAEYYDMKIEAVTGQSDGSFPQFVGADNEALGGRVLSIGR